MKMTKSIVAALAACLFFIAALSGCAPNPEKLFFGKWTDSAGLAAYEFMEDGTVRFSVFGADIKGHYAIDKKAGTVTLTGTLLTKSFSRTYRFDVTESTLTLTRIDSGDAAVYTRVAPPTVTQ